MEEGKVLSADDKMAMMGFQQPQVKQPENTELEVEKLEKQVEQKKEQVSEVSFDISSFNKKFERNFEKEDDIKSVFDKVGKYDELSKSYEALSQELSEYQRLSEGLDPMSHFLNEDEYIRQQFLKKNADKLGEASIKTLTSLTPSKIKDMDNVSALKTDLVVNQGLTQEEAEAYLMKHYNVEGFEDEDLDVATKASIKVEARTAKERLNKLYEGINIPEKRDWKEARQQLKDSWNKPVEEAVKGINKIKLAEGLDFNVTDAMKDGLYEESLNEILISGVKPSEAALGDIVSRINDKIVLRYMDDVVKSLTNDITEKVKAEYRSKYHNDKPFNSDARETGNVEDNDAKILSMI